MPSPNSAWISPSPVVNLFGICCRPCMRRDFQEVVNCAINGLRRVSDEHPSNAR